MAISNCLKSVKAWLGLLSLCCAFLSSSCADDKGSSGDSSKHHRHHGGGGGGRYGQDKTECSISRILPVRHPQYRDNNTYAHALALSGLPVYVASSQFGSIPFLFASLI